MLLLHKTVTIILTRKLAELGKAMKNITGETVRPCAKVKISTNVKAKRTCTCMCGFLFKQSFMCLLINSLHSDQLNLNFY